MALTSLVGAAMALLGVIGPVKKALGLGIAGALRPGFLSGEGPRPAARRPPVAVMLAPALVAAHYLWPRPFAQRALPTLPFHVLEALGTCLVFVAVLVGAPHLVRRLGGLFLRLIPGRESAARLVTRRRVEHLGHELVWSVTGVMMVASLLLVLHVVTHGLKREIATWADEALHDETFVLPWYPLLRADSLTPRLPPGERFALFCGRTPWPNAVHAVRAEDLAALAEEGGRAGLAALARRLGPGKILLSTLMARRLEVQEGDALDLAGKGGARRLTIVGVTDGLGFTPHERASPQRPHLRRDRRRRRAPDRALRGIHRHRGRRRLAPSSVARAGPRVTPFVTALARGILDGSLVLGATAPLVALYSHTSSRVGPMIAYASVTAALAVGLAGFVRAALAGAAEGERTRRIAAVVLCGGILLAAALQLNVLAAPILPEPTAFAGGIDGLRGALHF
jgi:hypothetical protein